MTVERDAEIERRGRAEEALASVQRATAGGPLRDTLRELTWRVQEVEYYRRHYEDAVPRERRVASFAQLRSSRSRTARTRSESRGVTGPARQDPPTDLGASVSGARQDPPGDPRAGASGARPSPSGDSHT